MHVHILLLLSGFSGHEEQKLKLEANESLVHSNSTNHIAIRSRIIYDNAQPSYMSVSRYWGG